MRRFLLLVAILLSAFTLRAQEDEEFYYPYAERQSEPALPWIESDSSLFYRAVQRPRDLYGEVTRYAFSEVAALRRGIAYEQERNTLDGLEISYRNLSLIRALNLHRGVEQPGEEGFLSLGDPYPSSHRLQVALTDSRYRMALRYGGHFSLPADWQLRLYAEGRIGRDAFSRGVYTRSVRAGLNLQKRWGEHLALSLTAAFAPSERGAASSSTREAFELVGDPYYNPAWGFCEGEERSARVKRELLPLVAAGLEWKITHATTLNAALTAEFGFLRRSSLGWFDARTPRPDNYRYLPSYFTDPDLSQRVADRWRAGDSRYTQIDWDELYTQNRMSRDGAYYVEQDAVEGITSLQGRIAFRTKVGEGLSLHYGAQAAYHLSCHYLELRDLLGADYLLDIDYYLLDDDTYASSLQNDLHNPNRRVGEGERFGYYYAFEQTCTALFLGADYRTSRWHLGAEFEVEWERIGRKGFYEKELFPGSGSYGDSPSLHFAPYRLTAEVGYAFTPRTSLGLHLRAEGRSPEADDLFLQPQYNNRPIDRPTLERGYDADLTFRHMSRLYEFTASAFLHLRSQMTQTGRYYDDLSGLFADRVVEGIAERTFGLELAGRYYLGERWRLSAALAACRATYISDPLVSLFSDRDNALISDRSESYMHSVVLGGVPQLAALLSATYYGRSWGLGCDLTYAGFRYAHADFMRRTVRVAMQAADSPEALDLFLAQERLPDLFRLDLSAWKSFRLGGETRLVLSLRVENLLGEDSTPYDGYESHRIRRLAVADGYTFRPFDNTLSYAPPRTFYLSASLRF